MSLVESQHIRPPTIKATDYAETMISDLKFGDESFTHSVTNLGVLALLDPGKGFKEIYRTLKPGGAAVVTTWKDPGNIHHVHRIQNRIRPDLPLFYPVNPAWQEELTLKNAFVEGGFDKTKVKVTEEKVFVVAKDVADLIDDKVSNSFRIAAQKDWTEYERAEWGEVARDEMTGEERRTAKIKMVAWVAVAEK